ncbi:hypothetical protein NW868_06520, partial [Synechococcus sp. R60.2]
MAAQQSSPGNLGQSQSDAVPFPKASPQAAARDPQHDKSQRVPSPTIWQGKIKAGHQKGAEIKL